MKHGMILTAAILLTGSLSFARGGDFGVGNGGDGLEMAFGGRAQGSSVPVSLSVSFEGLQKTWDKAKMMSEPMLVGSWKEIARASDPQSNRCPEEALYDSKGLENSDYSLPTLQIRYMTKTELEFTGEETGPILAVTFFNLGVKSKNQGPYKVRLDESQFSRYRYGIHGEIDKHKDSSSYVDYYCRILSADGKMICKYVTMASFSFPNQPQPTIYDKICTRFGVFAKDATKK